MSNPGISNNKSVKQTTRGKPEMSQNTMYDKTEKQSLKTIINYLRTERGNIFLPQATILTGVS